MKIKALVPFSNGTISMEQYEVREVTDSLGNELISAGIAVEIGGGGLPPVTASDAGKVLAVDNSGVWGASELAFYVGFEFDANEEYGIRSYPVDTADYKAAVESGKKIRVRIYEENGEEPLQTADAIYIGDVQFLGDSNEVYTATYFDTDAGVTKTLLFALSKESNVEEQRATVINPTSKDRYIVTLTPTSPDYSGTMDKTVAEIDAAYEAGQEIVFRTQVSATQYVETPLQYWSHDEAYSYDGFNTNIVQVAQNLFIVAYVGSSDVGTRNTYSTKVYTLTPAT